MKKIALVVMMAVVGMTVSAASVNWKVTASAYKGQAVYAFDMTAAALVAAFESNTPTDWTDAVGSAIGSGTIGAKGWSTKGTVADDSTSIVFAIINGDVAEGVSYVISSDISIAGMTYSGTETSPGSVALTATDFVKSGEFTSVPEPTSGLLLLVGASLLALRRKQN